jgi:hypothetical protein
MPVIGRPSGDAQALETQPGQLSQVASLRICGPHLRIARAAADENEALSIRREIRIIAVIAEP